ncbi:MAG: phage integrase N-terminal SAM-like domain-containing protein [Candidatus Bathyarchaeia archaeon]
MAGHCSDGIHCRYEDVLRDFHDFLIVEMRMEEYTAKCHCWNVRQFLETVKKEPNDVTRLDIRNYLLEQMKTKSQSTINNYLKSLSDSLGIIYKGQTLLNPSSLSSQKLRRKRFHQGMN